MDTILTEKNAEINKLKIANFALSNDFAKLQADNKRLKKGIDTILNLSALLLNPNLKDDIEQALKRRE